MSTHLVPFDKGTTPSSSLRRCADVDALGLDAEWPSQPALILEAGGWARLLSDAWRTLLAVLSNSERDLPAGAARWSRDGEVASLARLNGQVPRTGESVALVDIAAWDSDVADLVDHCWSGFRCDRSLSAFWAGPASSGFAVHYDTFHSVLVQLEGSKHWRLGPGPIANPNLDLDWSLARDFVGGDLCISEERALECTLVQGQALWIPPGWLHEGQSHGDGSLHATWSLAPYTRADLVRELVAEAHHFASMRQPALRPRAEADEVGTALEGALASLLKKARGGALSVDRWSRAFPD